MQPLIASFVIPAHNEENNIRETVRELQAVMREENIPYELILVNDNSTDNTAGVIAELMDQDNSIRTVDRTPPGGFGRAIRTGLDMVKGDLVIIYMADRSDDPRDAVAYYRRIEEGYDCVFGSRFRRGSRVENYPILKLIANRIVNRCIKLLFWCRFNDLTNAFKAYRTDVIRECGPFRASHFNITIEMSLSALVHGYNICEIPIRWYGRSWGSSNLRMSEMGRRYLQVLLKLFFEWMLISDDISAERMAYQTRSARLLSELSRRVEAIEEEVARLRTRLPEPTGGAVAEGTEPAAPSTVLETNTGDTP
jgi:dolichol-phosphate mannosyltransferase